MAARDRSGARGAWAYKALALLLVAGALGYAAWQFAPGLRPGPGGAPATTAARAGASDAVPAPAVAGTASAVNARAPAAATAGIAPSAQAASVPGSDDLASVVAPGQAPSMGEVIARLHDAGIRTGLGAFNPPGTSPPLIGLAVPEDYVLPPGYVRHFQATDDGQRIEPILMYSPDVELFDAAGQRIPIPADRVVPPERAPPGLELRAVRIPAPLDPRSPAT
jgi:hypothetical protein